MINTENDFGIKLNNYARPEFEFYIDNLTTYMHNISYKKFEKQVLTSSCVMLQSLSSSSESTAGTSFGSSSLLGIGNYSMRYNHNKIYYIRSI